MRRRKEGGEEEINVLSLQEIHLDCQKLEIDQELSFDQRLGQFKYFTNKFY